MLAGKMLCDSLYGMQRIFLYKGASVTRRIGCNFESKFNVMTFLTPV